MLNWLNKLLHHEQTTSKNEKLLTAFLFFIYIFFLGYKGNKLDGAGQAFYENLIKPSATPPEWFFPIIWSLLFILIGMAGYYVWNFYGSDRYRKIFAGLYAVNGLLVFSWSHLFFARQSLSGALYVIIGLIIVIELMILTAFKTNHKAGYLLFPYLAWILFITYINTALITLNL